MITIWVESDWMKTFTSWAQTVEDKTGIRVCVQCCLDGGFSSHGDQEYLDDIIRDIVDRAEMLHNLLTADWDNVPERLTRCP